MNKTVNEKTKGKIKDILKPGSIDSDTKLVILNTIYLNAKFVQPFPGRKDYPILIPFYETFNRKKIATEKCNMMLNDEAYFNYCSLNGNEIVRLPYHNTSIELVLVKQSSDKNYKSVTSDDFKNMKFEVKMLKLWVPKFKIEFGRTINGDLQTLGLVDAFNGGKADFSGMSPEKVKFIFFFFFVV